MSETGARGFFRGLSDVRLDLLDLLGPKYMMDAIVDSINARREQEMYWEYSSECLYGLCGQLGIQMNKRFKEILNPKPVDKRSGLEIAEDRLRKLGIKAAD